ncbi:MAG: NAD-dependent dehydratase, partial [Marinomonas sp.]
LGKAIPYGTVKRGNVAKVLASLIDLPLIRREIIELTDGDEAVDVALSNFAKA